MCGIVGYFGSQTAAPILIKGLKRLEYRGYDSAGMAILDNSKLQVVKIAGKVSNLEEALDNEKIEGRIGIAHTRWATHGEPNDTNAHPHLDKTGKIALIHNGIIENYSVLKTVLAEQGVEFVSETDTEVVVQLISSFYAEGNISFEKAVQLALQEVVGAYGIVTICEDNPDTMIAARFGSPLVLGIGENEYFFASDASPIIEHTRQVIYLEEGEMVIISPEGYTVKKIFNDEIVSKEITTLNMSIEEIEKGHFPHYMLKEIHDQEHTITDTMRGRLNFKNGSTHLGGINDWLPRIENSKHFYITACGTSWHAGLIGKYLIEEYTGIPVHVEYASEFRYRNAILDSNTVLIAISQSGETADTLAAIRKARNQGALTVGICNVVGSSIARETDCGIYTHAGPEIGVASTKAFTAQVTVLIMLACLLGRRKQLTRQEGFSVITALSNIDVMTSKILEMADEIKQVAEEVSDTGNFLYLGRGINFPVALEGALKLKEISYIHAEGYPAAEMKHGPIALIDEYMPVVFIAPVDKTYEKVVSNIQEVKARNGKIITITNDKTEDLRKLSDYVIEIPATHDHVFPILASIPLQLLAYFLAVKKGCNVDQPRNLAKSVTVE